MSLYGLPTHRSFVGKRGLSGSKTPPRGPPLKSRFFDHFDSTFGPAGRAGTPKDPQNTEKSRKHWKKWLFHKKKNKKPRKTYHIGFCILDQKPGIFPIYTPKGPKGHFLQNPYSAGWSKPKKTTYFPYLKKPRKTRVIGAKKPKKTLLFSPFTKNLEKRGLSGPKTTKNDPKTGF